MHVGVHVHMLHDGTPCDGEVPQGTRRTGMDDGREGVGQEDISEELVVGVGCDVGVDSDDVGRQQVSEGIHIRSRRSHVRVHAHGVHDAHVHNCDSLHKCESGDGTPLPLESSRMAGRLPTRRNQRFLICPYPYPQSR